MPKYSIFQGANVNRIVGFYCGVFLRKISPELTSVFIFLYFICGMPTTAWLLPSGAMSTPGIRTSKPQAAEKRNVRT